MGNCLRHESEIVWGGENWGSPDDWAASPEPKKFYRKVEDTRCRDEADDHDHTEEEEDDMLLGFGEKKKMKNVMMKRGLSSVGVEPCDGDEITTEVKIKITKKQLQELITMAEDVEGLSMQPMMLTREKSWRPALQSIPE
ncbi:hypothetical protein NE237_033250 [Protea cynaroides]|uniref:Uncharacterized protein n=1 Tax=Protea cynaroides TaxID=273540 RepID=A0A9Q0L4J1_9MAGN|nr:hypothetical protein NE237_033250 [Protea cynaroides]